MAMTVIAASASPETIAGTLALIGKREIPPHRLQVNSRLAKEFQGRKRNKLVFGVPLQCGQARDCMF